MTSYDILILGAGHAGVAIAGHLRQEGFAGSIGLVGDEPHAPYQRPPLTKAFLQGEMDLADLALGFGPEDSSLDRFAGSAAVEIDRGARTVRLADGSALGYGKLAIATGSRPRRLPAPEGADIHYLTTLGDCQKLKERLPSVERAIIIGGGFIGLEVAATLRRLGRSVALVEADKRLLARGASTALSSYLEALHRSEGVDLRLAAAVEAVEAGSVTLSDGDRLRSDVIIAGIGSLPNDELARQCGLACDNGILVDEMARTSDPDIVAAGDCTRHPNAHAPVTPFRLESVQNAGDQAVTAALTLLGRPLPYRALPTFWSDQFDARIAMAGISSGADELSLRGDPATGAFSVFCFRDGRLLAVESVNRPKDQRAARKLILTQGLTPDQARDEDVDLRAIPAVRQECIGA